MKLIIVLAIFFCIAACSKSNDESKALEQATLSASDVEGKTYFYTNSRFGDRNIVTLKLEDGHFIAAYIVSKNGNVAYRKKEGTYTESNMTYDFVYTYKTCSDSYFDPDRNGINGIVLSKGYYENTLGVKFPNWYTPDGLTNFGDTDFYGQYYNFGFDLTDLSLITEDTSCTGDINFALFDSWF